MICDNINNYKTYSSLGERIKKALDYLSNLNEQELVSGKNDIDENMYLNYFSYQTDKEENKIWESHQEYLDIHYILEGEETILLSDISTMVVNKEYDKSLDAAFFEGKEQIKINFSRGMFLICFPQDVHKVGVITDMPCEVKKAVLKVKI